MGGYGTLRTGAEAAGCRFYPWLCHERLLPRSPRRCTGDAAMEKLTSLVEVEKMAGFARSTLAVSAAWAPNVAAPPFYMDLPTRDGQSRPDVVARYAANALPATMSQYVPQLKRYKAIALDMGDKDNIAPDGPAMHEALQKLGIDHRFETYDGTTATASPAASSRSWCRILPGCWKAAGPDAAIRCRISSNARLIPRPCR